jgi:hypothetical protein
LELVNPPHQVSLRGPVIPNVKVITDAELKTVGVERLLAAAIAVENHT